MSDTKRVRVELDTPSYEALRYFGLLRGVPVGSVMRRALATFASEVSKDFPAVKAHVAATEAAEQARLDMIPY